MSDPDLSKEEEHELATIKAATLIESLPWLKRFSGKIVVVKFGGNAMVTAESAVVDGAGEHVVTATSTLVVRGDA